MCINVYTCYREFGGRPADEKPDILRMLELMGQRHFRKAAHGGAVKLATFVAPDGAQHVGAVVADGRDRRPDRVRPSAFRDMLSLIEAGPACLDRARQSQPAGSDALEALTAARPDAAPAAPARLPLLRAARAPVARQPLPVRHGRRAVDPAKVEIAKVWYERPVYYKGNPFSVVGHEAEVRWPAYSRIIDYELEIGLVIGRGGQEPRTGRRARPRLRLHRLQRLLGARRAVHRDAGPARSGEGQGLRHRQRARAMDHHRRRGRGSAGPRDDRARQRRDLVAWQQPRHEARLCDIVAYASLEETLYPGEILGSGTVGGGCGNELGRFLKDGDVVELEVGRIGRLRNRIVAPHVREVPKLPIKIL